MAVEPADRVGNYDLIQKIAEGGMGTVYKGRHRGTGEIVAIKIVAPHMVSNTVLLKRFQQEYNAARKFDHPNIVKAIDFDKDCPTPYLVMEYVEGESLGQKIQREGPMPEKDAIKIIAQVAQGLHKAHKEKLIHRDVKPDNILLNREGQAKLTDLGLVKEVAADLNLTRTGRGLGTPHFMAPEQFKNAKNADERCDIYSLGATLYMMVTGELPYRSSAPLDAYLKKMDNKITPARELVPSLSERTDWAIRRSMSADPEKRPTSCREFVEDLAGRSTRKPGQTDDSINIQQDLWYLVYIDEENKSHTVKGTTQAIRRSLKDNLLGDASNVRASRTKDNFQSLNLFPEFRDLVIEPAPMNPKQSSSKMMKTPPPSNSHDSMRGMRSAPPPVPGTGAIPAVQPPPAMPAPFIKDNKPQPPKIDFAMRPTRPPSSGMPVWLQVLLFLLLVAAAMVGGFFFLKQ